MNVYRKLAVCSAFLAAAVVTAQDVEMPQEDEDPYGGMFNAVVKLEVVTSEANPISPWQNVSSGGDGSGVVIAPGRILTCAHCVTDATFIRIRKHCEDSIYKGSVEFIDNDCDLALVKVTDPAFMRDITPMKIGVTPDEQAHVLAVGYPIGGAGISFTEGVVSRVENRLYVHSFKTLLAVQVDAAINPGNSGGPVLDTETGNICGIAFQGNEEGEALGYMIPPDVINHFLTDIQDGVVNGFCDWFFSIEALESESARKYYGLADGQTGVRIGHVDGVMGTNSLQVGDILLEVEGRKVANNGNIRINGNRRRSWYFPFTMKQIGESVSVTVLRGGKQVKTQVAIRKSNACNRGFLYDKKPAYFVCGGFAFSTLSHNLLDLVKGRFHTDIAREKAFADEEDVALVNVLPDDCVEGYLGADGRLVKSVNGEKVKNLKHLITLLENCKDDYIRFGLDDGDEWEYPVIVETAKMRAATPVILQTYQIPADRSEDLR